jgi:hypothetical protein
MELLQVWVPFEHFHQIVRAKGFRCSGVFPGQLVVTAHGVKAPQAQVRGDIGRIKFDGPLEMLGGLLGRAPKMQERTEGKIGL